MTEETQTNRTDDVPVEDFYEQRFVTEVAVSPDGDDVALVVDEFDGCDDERRRSLHVASADGTSSTHRLTRGSDAQSPKWGPDGNRLAFIAAREDKTLDLGKPPEETEESGIEAENGEDEPKQQVWVYDLNRGGDPRQITTRDEGVSEFDWSPSGDRIVVASRDPTDEEAEYLERRRTENGPIETTRLQHKRDGAGWLDSVTTYLFVVDIETGEATRLDDATAAGSLSPLYGLQPRWGPTDRIAFVTSHAEWPDDSHVLDLCTIDPDGGNLRVITDSELQVSGPRWSPEGSKLSFNAGNPENWYETTEAYVADVEAGTYESVSASLDRPIPFNGQAEWVNESELLCMVGDEGLTRLVRLRADKDDPKRVFESQGRLRSIQSYAVSGGTIGLVLTSPDMPPEAHTLDVERVLTCQESVERVSTVAHTFVENVEMPECRRITFDNSAGEEIEGIVYLPADFDFEEPTPHPVIASIHGGPMAYDAPEFDFDYLYWTNRGYVVVRTNYRGSTSYGQEFSEIIEADWGQREADDILSGVKSLVERGWANPDRAFVTGFSYGGIMTAQLLTRTDYFQAGAAEHGIYDLESVFGTNDSHPWHESELGLPWENPEGYRNMSSLHQVSNVDTPLLVTAGGEDWRCPPSQAEQLYVSVRKQGIDSKLVVYPDENHDIGDPDRAVHRLKEITEWFEAHDDELAECNRD